MLKSRDWAEKGLLKLAFLVFLVLFLWASLVAQ